jgi:hypothetical protein
VYLPFVLACGASCARWQHRDGISASSRATVRLQFADGRGGMRGRKIGSVPLSPKIRPGCRVSATGPVVLRKTASAAFWQTARSTVAVSGTTRAAGPCPVSVVAIAPAPSGSCVRRGGRGEHPECQDEAKGNNDLFGSREHNLRSSLFSIWHHDRSRDGERLVRPGTVRRHPFNRDGFDKKGSTPNRRFPLILTNSWDSAGRVWRRERNFHPDSARMVIPKILGGTKGKHLRNRRRKMECVRSVSILNEMS